MDFYKAIDFPYINTGSETLKVMDLHEIRKKLGIGEHETNIGIYVRKLMKDSAGWAQQ